jgi:hypothetical protein
LYKVHFCVILNRRKKVFSDIFVLGSLVLFSFPVFRSYRDPDMPQNCWDVKQPKSEKMAESFNIFPAVLLQLELGFIGGKILWI